MPSPSTLKINLRHALSSFQIFRQRSQPARRRYVPVHFVPRGGSIIIALLIVIVFGRNIINFLRRKQIGEEIRDLGLEGQLQKKGTPTMGGVIILLAILHPRTAFRTARHVYPTDAGFDDLAGLIGFLDDLHQVFRHHKEGLKGRFKIVGQVGLGII